METNRQEREEIEINLWELIRELWSKVGIIILSAFVVAVAVMLFDKVVVTPQYVSTTKMIVLAKQNSDVLTSGDLQASTLLTKDYAELIKSRQVTETVIAQLGLTSGDEAMEHEELLKEMTVEIPADTRIVTISVKDKDPYQACEKANAIRNAAAQHILKVMNTEAVNVAEEANIPQEPSSPSTMKDGVIGGLIGGFLAIAVIVIFYLMNDTIKTSEDIERYLNLSTLGTIPLADGERKSTRSKTMKNRRKK